MMYRTKNATLLIFFPDIILSRQISMIHPSTRALVRNMLILSESEVRRCFPISSAITANRKALASLRKDGDGGAMVPTRIGLPYQSSNADGGKLESTSTPDWSLFKPAAYYPPQQMAKNDEETLMGMKIISIRANNPKLNKPMCPSTVMLVHAETGEVSAIVAATYLTAARTAAGSALATELALSKHPSGKYSFTLVVFGAGLQAEMHIKAIKHVVNISKVVIINRTLERAENLKTEILQSNNDNDKESKTQTPITDISTISLSDDDGVCNALRIADIITTTTNTCIPLFRGELLKPGCHINGIGSYTPLMREVDDVLVSRCEVIIDTKEAMDVGDLSSLRNQDEKVPSNYIGLIGDAIVGNIEIGKQRDDPNSKIDCTFFKSSGTAIQDVVSAQYACNYAVKNNVGKNIEM